MNFADGYVIYLLTYCTSPSEKLEATHFQTHLINFLSEGQIGDAKVTISKYLLARPT